VPAMRERGVETKPYLPAIHLMSFYRERFGHREGEFPVCEDVAARSLALPFYPALSEGEVAQVAETLRGVIEDAQTSGFTSATNPGSPRPGVR
jgi:perosamine synthetase